MSDISQGKFLDTLFQMRLLHSRKVTGNIGVNAICNIG